MTEKYITVFMSSGQPKTYTGKRLDEVFLELYRDHMSAGITTPHAESLVIGGNMVWAGGLQTLVNRLCREYSASMKSLHESFMQAVADSVRSNQND